jgi:hypothetical protein
LFCEIIEAGQQAGLFRPLDALMAAAMLKAMLQDWYLKRGKYREREVGVEQYAVSVIDLMDNYLQSKGRQ